MKLILTLFIEAPLKVNMNAPVIAPLKQFMTTPDPIIKNLTPSRFLMSQKPHLTKVRARFVHKQQSLNLNR